MNKLSQYKQLLLIIFTVLIIGAGNIYSNEMEKLLFDETTFKLSEAVMESSQRHAIYAYIIANSTTPDIDLFGLLPPDDLERINRTLPESEDRMKILVEYTMSRIGENIKRQQAYTALTKKKFDILNKVISKGQR